MLIITPRNLSKVFRSITAFAILRSCSKNLRLSVNIIYSIFVKCNANILQSTHCQQIIYFFGILPRFPHYIMTAPFSDKHFIVTCHYMVLSVSLNGASCAPYSERKTKWGDQMNGKYSSKKLAPNSGKGGGEFLVTRSV